MKRNEASAETAFVAWWEATVKVAGNPAKKGKELIVAEQRQLTVAEAINTSGITKQQVSKWDRRLAEPEKFGKLMVA